MPFRGRPQRPPIEFALILQGRSARAGAPSGEDLSGENQWAARSAAHQFVGQKSESLILEYVYDCARTYFIRNF